MKKSVIALVGLLGALSVWSGCSTTSKKDPTPTQTQSPTITTTHSRTRTFTRTDTGTLTYTSSPTISGTPTFTATRTATRTSTVSRTITQTFTISNTPTITLTFTETLSFTISHTETNTITLTYTCVPGTCSNTPTPLPVAGYIAVSGGNCSTTVYVAPILSPGVLGGWTPQPNYPVNYGRHGLIYVANCVYSAGGYDCGSASDSTTTYSAAESNGTLSGWTSTSALPTGLSTHGILEDGGYVFLLGDAGAGGSIYRGTLGGGCTATSWTAQGGLPGGRSYAGYVKMNGYAYFTGGDPVGTGAGGAITAYWATIGAGSIGAWTSNFPLPTPPRYGHTMGQDGAYVYIFGGASNATTAIAATYRSQILGGGSYSSWSSTTVLPAARMHHATVTHQGYVYVIGGSNGSSAQSTVYVATMAGGVIGAWTTATALPVALMHLRATAW